MDHDFLDIASYGEFDTEIGSRGNEKLSEHTLLSINTLCPTESHATSLVFFRGPGSVSLAV